jgi:gluconokinase
MSTAKNICTSVSKDLPLYIIAGPAGCGKTTIGLALAESNQFTFIEGDTLHPAENIAKMSAGIALVDDDRWEWLDRTILVSREVEKQGSPLGIVLTCSSLKKAYRDRLRWRIEENRAEGSRLQAYFVFCEVTEEECMRRVQSRAGHYMKAGMVASQFSILELPLSGEESRTYVLNGMKSLEEVKQDVLNLESFGVVGM